MGKVVSMSQHQATKKTQIEQQEKRASEALLVASKEFKRLAELKAK